MESKAAAAALRSLGQEQRLTLFRLLVRAGEEGMSAGAISEALGAPKSSLSFHLDQLKRAGLVRQQRRYRSIIYSADLQAMDALVAYLLENCCGGEDARPEA